jgi:hypothetical protein
MTLFLGRRKCKNGKVLAGKIDMQALLTGN